MAQRRPPTPDTGDDSLALGPLKETIDAEACVLINFYAQTSPGGEFFEHNLWFHESWTGFDAPMNILFGEMHEKPTVLILPNSPEGDPKRRYIYDLMKFHGPRRARPDFQTNNSGTRNSWANDPTANAGRPSYFGAFMNSARRMFDGVHVPAVEVPPAQWWFHKFKLLLKMVLAMIAIVLVIQAAIIYTPQLSDVVKSKFTLINQATGYSNIFNTHRGRPNADRGYPETDGDFFGTNRDNSNTNGDNSNTKGSYFPFGKGHSNTDKDRVKAAKDPFESNRDNTKTGEGHMRFRRNADGNNIRGSWVKPDGTHVTFEASKGSGGDPPVTEVKFVQTEEQFIKDENDSVLFSLNRITRFFVTLIGGDEHDEKLDKIMDGIGSISYRGKKKRWWRWW